MLQPSQLPCSQSYDCVLLPHSQRAAAPPVSVSLVLLPNARYSSVTASATSCQPTPLWPSYQPDAPLLLLPHSPVIVPTPTPILSALWLLLLLQLEASSASISLHTGPLSNLPYVARWLCPLSHNLQCAFLSMFLSVPPWHAPNRVYPGQAGFYSENA